MKFNKKIVIITITLTAVFVISIITIHKHNHPTHYLYNDSWIIGKNSEQISERYGEYDYNSHSLHDALIKGYCVKQPHSGWFGTDWPEYYMIYFDQNGKAYKVDLVVGGWGG